MPKASRWLALAGVSIAVVFSSSQFASAGVIIAAAAQDLDAVDSTSDQNPFGDTLAEALRLKNMTPAALNQGPIGMGGSTSPSSGASAGTSATLALLYSVTELPTPSVAARLAGERRLFLPPPLPSGLFRPPRVTS